MKESISKKVISTCFLAGCLEIYDFTIFAFLSTSFHKNYFTFLSQSEALIITYSLFAVGFLFRPLGAILFGYVGDRYGRKHALILSVTLMGFASLGLSILPTYQAIGVWSCYMLAFLRIVQGISVGGEYSGAIIYAVESIDSKRAGVIGSIVVCGCMSGVLLATVINSILNLSFMPTYGWRLAFLLGSSLSLIGFFIRKSLYETPEFIELSTIERKLSIIEGLKLYKRQCLAAIFVAATNGANLYFMTVYLPNYLKTTLNKNITYVPTVLTCFIAIFIPVFGYISDRYSIRKNLIVLGIGLLAIYALVLLPLFYLSISTKLLLFLVILYSVIFSLQAGTANTFIVEIFPTQYRFICSAFCYSIGMGIIGGSSPMIASLITKYISTQPSYVSLYISLISSLGCVGVILVPYKQNHQRI